MVEKMRFGLLHSTSSREQKKLAPRIPRFLQDSAIVKAMVIFPVPADPLIQNIHNISIVMSVTPLAPADPLDPLYPEFTNLRYLSNDRFDWEYPTLCLPNIVLVLCSQIKLKWHGEGNRLGYAESEKC
jgi:hypothetical protein